MKRWLVTLKGQTDAVVLTEDDQTPADVGYDGWKAKEIERAFDDRFEVVDLKTGKVSERADVVKADKIALIKAKASDRILAIADLITQMNDLRLIQEDADPDAVAEAKARFAKIDEIRDWSNAEEAKLN